MTSLLKNLATVAANRIQPTVDLPANPIQRGIFELLGVGVCHRFGDP